MGIVAKLLGLASGLSTMWIIGIVTAVVLALGGGHLWQVHTARTEGFTAGAEKQLEKDKAEATKKDQEIGKLDALLLMSQSDAKGCIDGNAVRNAADRKFQILAEQAQAEARAEAQRRKIDNAKSQARISDLERIASAKPNVNQSCADTVGKADAILDEQLRRRRTR